MIEKGPNGATIDAYGNLLKHYGSPDGAKVANKIKDLKNTKKVSLKNMDLVYENGGELKKTINVIDRVEDNKEVVRWLEEGLTDAEAISKGLKGGRGWRHIKRPERWNQITSKFGQKSDTEVQKMILETIKTGKITRHIKDDEIKYTKKFLAKGGTLQDFSVAVSDRAKGIGKGNVLTAHPGV